jgi:hypothetical protein
MAGSWVFSGWFLMHLGIAPPFGSEARRGKAIGPCMVCGFKREHPFRLSGLLSAARPEFIQMDEGPRAETMPEPNSFGFPENSFVPHFHGGPRSM